MEGLAAVTARIAQIQSMVPAPAVWRPQGAARPGPAFADALSAAQTAQAGSAGTAADVAAFKTAWPNGRVPDSAMVSIGGGHRLAAPAAPAFEKMAAAARRDGVELGVSDSYRTIDAQADLVRRKGLYSQGGLAARPGTSQHGWGLAVDLRLDDKAQAWMRANGPKWGFVEDTPREPWHWTFKGV